MDYTLQRKVMEWELKGETSLTDSTWASRHHFLSSHLHGYLPNPGLSEFSPGFRWNIYLAMPHWVSTCYIP